MKDTLVKPYLDLYGFTWAEKHIPMYRYRGDYKLMAIGIGEVLHIRHDRKGNYYKGFANENMKWDGRNLDFVLRKNKIKVDVSQMRWNCWSIFCRKQKMREFQWF